MAAQKEQNYMSQEMNKKAVADLFCIEDARAVCEAIGGLGLKPNDEATDEPLDYTPDNILDVTVNENPDGMPAFPQLGQEEMDSETQAFVVDELAKELQADGRESLTDEDLIPFMVKIKGENHISQDLTSFIDQITSNADARLATQNTSEAQPNGVATDLSNGGEGEAPAADPLAAAGMGELPPEAPGGLAEPTEAPALDANPDDAFSLDAPGAEPGAEGDFNLDVPEPGAEVGAEGGDDSFNLDIGDEGGEASADDGTDTIGELDFGDEGGEGGEAAPAEGGEAGSEEDDLFSALDGMSDEALDDGSADEGGEEAPAEGGEEAPVEDEEKPAETEAKDGAATPVIENPGDPNSEKLPENGPAKPIKDECGDATAECGEVPPATVECGEVPPTTVECGEVPPTTVEGVEDGTEEVPTDGEEILDESIDSKLESIKANYVESIARERVRAVVESYERKRDMAEKEALCESIIADYKARHEAEDRQAMVESTMGEKLSELGDKVATLCESADKADALDAKFESILGQFKAEKASEAASQALDAKFESILAGVKADKEVDAKLAAIVESVKAPKAAAPKAAPAAPKAGLDAKLESIIATAKQKIAAAK
jgi:hypothetical protein